MSPLESRERESLAEALRDMLAGWKYIRDTHGDLYGVGWDRAQQKAEEALAALSAPAPQVLPLCFKPHFPDCETAEPSLSNMIHRYYGFYFDKPRSTEYAEAYIAALQGAKP